MGYRCKKKEKKKKRRVKPRLPRPHRHDHAAAPTQSAPPAGAPPFRLKHGGTCGRPTECGHPRGRRGHHGRPAAPRRRAPATGLWPCRHYGGMRGHPTCRRRPKTARGSVQRGEPPATAPPQSEPAAPSPSTRRRPTAAWAPAAVVEPRSLPLPPPPPHPPPLGKSLVERGKRSGA